LDYEAQSRGWSWRVEVERDSSKAVVEGSGRAGEERLRVALEGFRVIGSELGVVAEGHRAAKGVRVTIDSGGSGGGAPTR